MSWGESSQDVHLGMPSLGPECRSSKIKTKMAAARSHGHFRCLDCNNDNRQQWNSGLLSTLRLISHVYEDSAQTHHLYEASFN